MPKLSLEKKRAAYQYGLKAEKFAAWYLRFKGFAILERRYKTIHGEIDLIARRFNLVVIVEVKARPTLLDAMESVTYEAQQRIKKTANFWLKRQKYHHRLTLRFDLIAICPKKIPQQIENFF